MKKLFTMIMLALFVQAGFAQETDNEMKTLFTGKNLKYTGMFLSPELKGTIINDSEDKDGYGFILGGRMGVIFNDKYSVGLGGYGLTTTHTVNLLDYAEINDAAARLGFGYGGVVLEYIVFGNKVMHFTIPVLIGGGGVSLYKDISVADDNVYWDDFKSYESSGFFVIEPGFNVEINLTKFMRLDVGASYRMVKFSEMNYLDDSDAKLSNFGVNASLKFGIFNKVKKEKEKN